MKKILMTVVVFASAAASANTWTCINQSKPEDQKYPSEITLNINEKGAEIKAVTVDENSASIATIGQTFKAERLESAKEAKYKIPTYAIHDGEKVNGHYTYFANDERNSDVLMFVNSNQELTFWLHFNGGDYWGVDKDTFKCK